MRFVLQVFFFSLLEWNCTFGFKINILIVSSEWDSTAYIISVAKFLLRCSVAKFNLLWRERDTTTKLQLHKRTRNTLRITITREGIGMKWRIISLFLVVADVVLLPLCLSVSQKLGWGRVSISREFSSKPNWIVLNWIELNQNYIEQNNII